jgi:hypothetical protein
MRLLLIEDKSEIKPEIVLVIASCLVLTVPCLGTRKNINSYH